MAEFWGTLDHPVPIGLAKVCGEVLLEQPSEQGLVLEAMSLIVQVASSFESNEHPKTEGLGSL